MSRLEVASTHKPKPSDDRLVGSIRESAQYISTVTLTFLAVCVYLGIAVASTTHEVLFLGKSIDLPLFHVAIPLSKFFWIAPFLLVFLHAHLLILDYLLQKKIERFVRDDNPPEQETDLFFASLPLSILLGQDHPGLVRVLLGGLFLGVMVLVPVGLLAATQVVFLPYHDLVITTWHKFLVLFDMGLVWYFLLKMPDLRIRTIRVEGGYARRASGLRVSAILIGLSLTLGMIVISTVMAAGQPVGYEFRTGRPFPLAMVFSRNLSLVDHVLLAEPPPSGQEPSPQNVKGVQLAGRDLRGADFTGAVLVNADFRGANLEGAIFRQADLRGARFSPLRETPWLEATHRKSLAETFEETPTILREADFQGALLGGRASFSHADLRGARLDRSDLEGADLSHADLRGAYLRGANLPGASLASSRLLGADLSNGNLPGANLRAADLREAKLVGATADAADFSGAQLLGSDLRSAELYLVKGLTLIGVDLRGARLGGMAAPCGSGSLLYPKLSDLRHVDFRGPGEEDLKRVANALEKRRQEPKSAYGDVLDALARARSEKAPCLVVMEENVAPFSNESLASQIERNVVLYDRESQAGDSPGNPLKDWPPPVSSAAEYYQKIADRLFDEACADHDFFEALIRDISGDIAPERPDVAYAVAHVLSKEASKCAGIGALSKEEQNAIARAQQKDPLRGDDPGASRSGS